MIFIRHPLVRVRCASPLLLYRDNVDMLEFLASQVLAIREFGQAIRNRLFFINPNICYINILCFWHWNLLFLFISLLYTLIHLLNICLNLHIRPYNLRVVLILTHLYFGRLSFLLAFALHPADNTVSFLCFFAELILDL